MGPKHPSAPGTGWGSVDVDDVLAVLDHVARQLHVLRSANGSACRAAATAGSWPRGWPAATATGSRRICSERAVNNMLSEEWSSDIGSIFRVEHGPSHIDDPEEYTLDQPDPVGPRHHTCRC